MKRFLPLAALSAIAFALILPFLLTGTAPAANDYGSSAIPAFATLTGHTPFVGAPSWTPAIFGGAPEEVFAAMPRYPLNVLAYVLAPETALLLFIAIHLALAAAGAWFFTRRFAGTSETAATAGALVYAFSGALWFRGQHPDYLAVAAWMPFILWSVWEIAAGDRSVRQRFAVLLAISTGAVLLTGGGAPIVMMTALCSVAILVEGNAFRGESAYPRMAGLSDALATIGLAGLAGVAIGAPGWVPFLATIADGARGKLTLGQSGAFSIPPPGLLRLFVPDLLIGKGWTFPRFVECWCYAGVLTLPLASFGARTPRGRLLLLFSIATLVLALGIWGPLHWILYFALPGYSHFRAPARWAVPFTLFLGGLAARGLDTALTDASVRGHAWIAARVMGGLALAAVIAAIAAPAGSALAAGRMGLVFFALQAALAAAWLHGLTRQRAFEPDRATRPSGGRGLHAAHNLHEKQKASARLETHRDRITAAAALLLLAVDLSGTMLRKPLEEKPQALAAPAVIAAAAAGNHGRLIHDGTWPAEPRALNNGVRWGYRNARGYSQIIPARYSALLDLGRPSAGARFTAMPERFDAGLMRLLGVGTYVGAAGSAPPPGFEATPIATDSRLSAFRASQPPFEAAVVDRAVVMANEDAERAASLVVDPATAAVLSEDASLALPGPSPEAAGTARVERIGTDEVVVHVEAQRAGLLVLADSWNPRWRATVDGVRTPILRADAIWRAVRVTAGPHEVRFLCAGAAAWWTILLSAIGVGFVVAMPRLGRRS